MSGEDRLRDLLAALARLREREGADAHLRAIADARAAVARVVLRGAERRAGLGPKGPDARRLLPAAPADVRTARSMNGDADARFAERHSGRP